MTQGYGTDNVFGSHQDWGFRYGDDSYAIDFSQSGCDPYGKPVLAMADGTVMETTEAGSHDHGYGNSVLVDHGFGFVSRYAHLSRILVSEGESVDRRTRIGEVGNTGFVSGHSCPEHPGTHLHIAVYEDGEAIEPFPISGRYGMQRLCWYNREGDEDCSSGQPADYVPEDEDYSDGAGEWGELTIDMMELYPRGGNVGETEFIWSTVVNTVNDDEPEVTLWIYNPTDDVSYSFEMETESESSPWIFVYRKTLRDSSEYSYWIEAESDDGDAITTEESIRPDPDNEDVPEFDDFIDRPTLVDFGDESSFEVSFESENWPDMWLYIANPLDAYVYRFEMNVDYEGGDLYVGRFEKELYEQTTYAYWVVAESYNGTNTSPVEFVRVE